MSDPGGSLAVYAGGNIQATGAQIVSAGSVELNARGDVTLDSVTTGQSESIRWSSRNLRIDGSSSETGTTVSGGTNVVNICLALWMRALTASSSTLSATSTSPLDRAPRPSTQRRKPRLRRTTRRMATQRRLRFDGGGGGAGTSIGIGSSGARTAS